MEKKVYQLWQDMADAKLGWSNKGVRGNAVESVTGDIETSYGKSSVKYDTT